MRLKRMIIAATVAAGALLATPGTAHAADDTTWLRVSSTAVTAVQGKCVDVLITAHEPDIDTTLSGYQFWFPVEVLDPQGVTYDYEVATNTETYRETLCSGTDAYGTYQVYGGSDRRYHLSFTFSAPQAAATKDPMCVTRHRFNKVTAGWTRKHVSEVLKMRKPYHWKSRRPEYAACDFAHIGTIVFSHTTPQRVISKGWRKD